MRYFLVEPKYAGHIRLKALLVVAETPDEALSFVPEESRDTYVVTRQSRKRVDDPAGLITAFHQYESA